jgi:hypothetical protein
MKKTKFIFVILCFIGLTAFGQSNSVTGTIKNVNSYNDQYAMTVGNTNLVLIVNLKDKTTTSFEVNKEYSDILIKKDGKYVLNPKYANQTFTITYYVNGKGWNCIKTIEPAKQ